MRARSLLFLVLLQFSLSCAGAQESPVSAVKTKQTSPEMRKLFNTFLGTWSVAEKIEPNETMPKGGTVKVRKSIAPVREVFHLLKRFA